MPGAAKRWSGILVEAQHSGLSMRAFARSRGLNPNTLAWWKWKLDQVPMATRSASFVEIGLAEASPLRVRVGEAIVDVDEGTDLGLLRRVVEALA